MSASITEALERAKLSEKTVPVCLDADAIEAYREAEEAAAAAATDSLSGKISVPQELADAVEAATVRLTLRARSSLEWRELIKKHPPRKDHPLDRQLGFNEETFYAELVRSSIIAPEIGDAQWADIRRYLTEGEWTRLCGAAQALNLKVSQLPF